MTAEIIFHRYFQRDCIPSEERSKYKGKLDLDSLEADSSSLLRNLQDELNRNLLREHGARDDGQPYFHLDYVEATVPNALAFQTGGISFIGITAPLLNDLSHMCTLLASSSEITALFGLDANNAEHREIVGTELFATALIFVVCHEYGHLMLGHRIQNDSDELYADEVLDSGRLGNYRQQAQEIDADGFALYFLLHHLILGERRTKALSTINEELTSDLADEKLFSQVIVAVGAFFLTRRIAFQRETVADKTHPPQAARMSFTMRTMVRWCDENRPTALRFVDGELFRRLMKSVHTATQGASTVFTWPEQAAFLESTDGTTYINRLTDELNHLRDARRL